jgi:two-component system chemotaxis response regulator CheY
MSLRILIVDDNPAIRFMLREFIEKSGHQVVDEAEDQESAVKAYARHKPDVVTLDLSLKEGDGLGVLKSLRELDANAKVLVISANSQKKVLETVYAAGAVGFLAKPLHSAEFMAAVVRATLG